ncbi:MAG: hypothetical protein AAF962_04850 [Actinomycetota bacterium]
MTEKTEKIPPRFRKTKTDKWAVMAPVEDLEKALAEGGKIDVLKKSGDWSSFRVASLGRPFDVDGVSMCYGYGPDDEAEGGADGGSGGSGGEATSGRGAGGDTRSRGGAPRRSAPARAATAPPPNDPSEPLPEYQGGAEDEWDGGF